LGAAAAALPLVARRVSAADYPTRPVQVIVGQAAGSSSDITTRLLTQPVSERLKQQFVVQVRPGATGNIATEAVRKVLPAPSHCVGVLVSTSGGQLYDLVGTPTYGNIQVFAA